MDETGSTYLKLGKKVMYMGHRQFLVASHPARRKASILNRRQTTVLNLNIAMKKSYLLW